MQDEIFEEFSLFYYFDLLSLYLKIHDRPTELAYILAPRGGKISGL